jgi:hypothetical protein
MALGFTINPSTPKPISPLKATSLLDSALEFID